MPPRRKIDYDRLEKDWRIGIKSPRQMAEEYTAQTGVPVTHAAIVNHFKRNGVDRDLSAKVKAKADALVTLALVTKKVTKPLPNEREIVEGVATLRADVQISHRKDIRRMKGIVEKLLSEVDGATIQEGVDPPSEVLTLPQRVDSTKKLIDCAKTLVTLECEVWGISKELSDAEPAQPGHNIKIQLPDHILAMIPVRPIKEIGPGI